MNTNVHAGTRARKDARTHTNAHQKRPKRSDIDNENASKNTHNITFISVESGSSL